MNHWFQRHAWTNHAAGIPHTNVICDIATCDIIESERPRAELGNASVAPAPAGAYWAVGALGPILAVADLAAEGANAEPRR